MNLRPLVPNYGSTNSKCFVWCRLGNSAPVFLSLSCTELVPRIKRRLLTKMLRSSPACPNSSVQSLYSCTTDWNSERRAGAVMRGTGPLPFHNGSSVLLEPQMRIGPCGTSGGLRLSGRSPTCRLRGGSTIWCPALCPHPHHNPSGYGRSTHHRPLKPTPR